VLRCHEQQASISMSRLPQHGEISHTQSCEARERAIQINPNHGCGGGTKLGGVAAKSHELFARRSEGPGHPCVQGPKKSVEGCRPWSLRMLGKSACRSGRRHLSVSRVKGAMSEMDLDELRSERSAAAPNRGVLPDSSQGRLCVSTHQCPVHLPSDSRKWRALS